MEGATARAAPPLKRAHAMARRSDQPMLCHNVNIEFVHAWHEEFLLPTHRGPDTMRQEIGLDVIFHQRLELFDNKQLVDTRCKVPDPVER